MKSSFTLLELVVVILIMGIVLFLLTPNLAVKYQEVKFDNFSYQLLQFFKSAQDSSFKENALIEVRVDSDFFELYKDNNRLSALAVPQDYKIEKEAERVVFYPSGLLRVYSGNRVLNSAEIRLIFGETTKKIVFYSEAGNVFIEE